MKKQIATKTCILIIGMHRSGTSATSGCFSKLGYSIGNTIIAANKFNAKGYFENDSIFRYNDRLLELMSATWSNTLFLNENWWQDSRILAKKSELIEILSNEYNSATNIIIKDPRISVLLPFYLLVLDELSITVKVIINFRNPLEVAASLNKRYNMAKSKAILLYMDALLKGEKYSRSTERVFVHYNAIIRNPIATIAETLQLLNINKNLSETEIDDIKSFIEPKLKHNQIDESNYDKSFPEYVLDLHTSLKDYYKNDDNQNNKGFDEISARFYNDFNFHNGIDINHKLRIDIENNQDTISASFPVKIGLNSISFQFDPLSNIQKIKVFPLSTKTSIHISKLEATDINGDTKKLDIGKTNAEFKDENNFLVFESDEPYFHIHGNEFPEMVEIHITINYFDYSNNTNRTSIKKRNEYENTINEKLNAAIEQVGDDPYTLKDTNQEKEKLKDGIIQSLNTEIAGYKKLIAEKGDNEKRLSFEIEQKEKQLLSIANSKSWRITKPLRKVGLKKARLFWQFLKHKKTIIQSGFFDKDYYLRNNPDIVQSKKDPLRHYFLHGGFEGRNPSNRFNSTFYLENYPDVAEREMNPLLHYIMWGNKEGRANNPKSLLPGQAQRKWNDATDDGIKSEYQIWLNGHTPIQEVFDRQRVITGTFENPNRVFILIQNNGDYHALAKTFDSLAWQSYTYWYAGVFLPKTDSSANDGLTFETLFKKYQPGKFEIISNLSVIFDKDFSTFSYLAFLEAGEILSPDCLWEMVHQNAANASLIYADHDYYASNGGHSDPWLTPNWSPQLLLSQNYIGGFYLISTPFFFELYKQSECRQKLIQKIPDSQAWRYAVLLKAGANTGAIERIPRLLWSEPESNDRTKIMRYHNEIAVIESHIIETQKQAKISSFEGGKIRRLKWGLETDPLVSIIIPTTGNLKYLKKCLDSLLHITAYPNIEIIVMDNGRGKYPEGIAYAKSKASKVIEVNEPFNWARLNNIGVAQSQGELLLFLNDDVEIIESDWLTEMVRQVMQKNTGIVGSLLLYPDGKIQHAGVFLVDHGGGARHYFHKQMPGQEVYKNLDNCVREISAITGACMMTRRNTFEQMEGFDENMPLVGNDIDFCLKCLEADYVNIYTPFAKLIHHESVSRKAKPIEEDEKRMWDRWGVKFRNGDHYYNPNLTLHKEDCSLGKHTTISDYKNHDLFTNRSKPGLNQIAYIRAEMGLGEAARGYAKAMESASIPFGIINFENGNPASMTNLSMQGKEISETIFDINLIHVNADFLPFTMDNMDEKNWTGKYNIGFWVWELQEFPDRWTNAFGLVDEIWVPSDFVNKAISAKSPVPVITIPHVISSENNANANMLFPKSHFNIPESRFVFLSMFDVHSESDRKNPAGSIAAFKKAFAGNDTSVALIIKVNQATMETSKELEKLIGDYENIFLLTRHLNSQEMDSLFQHIDCFVSLHRAEGFGLAPAEAMARGKVALLTNWSGNTQYMNPENCIPINYQLVPLQEKVGPYDAEQLWAEPDLEEAARQMKNIVMNPVLAKEIGEKARRTIAEELSPQKIGEMIKARLDVIVNEKMNNN